MVLEILFPIGLLLVLLAIGVPVAFSLAIAGWIGLLTQVGVDSSMVIMRNVTYANVAFYLLSTIPMFILMAEFLNESELTALVFRAANRWLSGVKGGLAFATTVANGGMAALSGSSTATAATMARMAVPEMQKYGYDDRLSLGTVAAAGTFAVMIPPSLGLIIYGVMTETSIARLFIAGIVPGLLTVVGYGLTIYVWGAVNTEVIGDQTGYTWDEKFASLKPIWPAVIVVLLVIGGLYLGVVTPTEAGALGALGTFVVAVTVGGMRLKGTKRALLRTAETTTMIFMIVIGAMIFGRWLAITGATRLLIDAVAALPVNRWIILVIVLAIYVLMGTLMDQLAILILTLPITFPLATSLGYNPIWFGILIAKTIEIGLVTPPLGLNVYVASGATDLDAEVGFKGAIRFIPIDIIIIFVLMLFPQLVLFLPDYMN